MSNRIEAFSPKKSSALRLEEIPALLARLPRTKNIATAARTDLGSPLFEALVAQWPLERRAKEAGALHVRIQILRLLALIMRNRRSAFLAEVALVGIVSSAHGTFDRVFNLGFLMAAIAPGTARSAIRHRFSPPTYID